MGCSLQIMQKSTNVYALDFAARSMMDILTTFWARIDTSAKVQLREHVGVAREAHRGLIFARPRAGQFVLQFLWSQRGMQVPSFVHKSVW